MRNLVYEGISPKLVDRVAASNEVESLAVVLAGSDGYPAGARVPASLRGLRPSQFSRVPGGDFVIDETRRQIAAGFPPEKIRYVVTESHSQYYRDLLGDVPEEHLIVQPQDDGSVFSIIYAAMRLSKSDPLAALTFFPADFSATDTTSFMQRVRWAESFIRRQPKLVLFGTRQGRAGQDGQLIEFDQDEPLSEPLEVWQVRSVLPAPRGGEHRPSRFLSDSSVIVGTAASFLRNMRSAVPDVYEKLEAVRPSIGSPDEPDAVRRAYFANHSYVDLHRDVLPVILSELAVIPVPDPIRAGVAVRLPVRSLSVQPPAPRYAAMAAGAV